MEQWKKTRVLAQENGQPLNTTTHWLKKNRSWKKKEKYPGIQWKGKCQFFTSGASWSWMVRGKRQKIKHVTSQSSSPQSGRKRNDVQRQIKIRLGSFNDIYVSNQLQVTDCSIFYGPSESGAGWKGVTVLFRCPPTLPGREGRKLRLMFRNALKHWLTRSLQYGYVHTFLCRFCIILALNHKLYWLAQLDSSGSEFNCNEH